MNTVVQNYPRQHHISLPHNTPHIPHNATNNVPSNTTKCMQVVGIPSVHIANNRLVVGSSSSSSTRSYTPLKVLGDGSFGTVWLCDWHGTLPPNTPLSPMQCGAGARPEWAGKRLVAVKRMKKRWEGGWDECQQLKELESLRAIPFHPNIIPLYDFFLLPATKELYFVFESMEGNLYHLIKARKGRPLAGGLVASIFFQIVSGLAHIHANGYFHRDMKPENVLVTTTGLFDYTPLSPPHSPPEKDVVAIIKLADFGLARETKSVPPYTEYVSTRWYRAPEVLLLSRDYSNPVDMWALGTIMAELVNLRPLFPGSDQADQISKICQVLGNPDDYGEDSSGGPLGGGSWPTGLHMAEQVGFEFRKMPPQDIHSLFDPSVPTTLIHCIRDLLKFDPDARLTSHQCLHHPYLVESLPRNNIPLPPGVRLASQPRTSPPSHSLHIPNAATSHRSPFFSSASPSPGPSHANGDPMDISPQTEVPPYPIPAPNASTSSKPLGKFSGLGKKFGLGRFGSDKHSNANPQQDLPAVQENPGPVASSSTGSLRLNRTQSTGSDRPPSSSPTREQSGSNDPKLVTKLNKKEAERLHREAEKQRRELALKTQREQARAVMQKRNMIIQNSKSAKEIEWTNTTGTEQPTVPPSVSAPAMSTMSAVAKGKQPAVSLGPIRTSREHGHGHHIHTNGANVSPRFGHPPAVGSSMHHDMMDWRDGERSSKLRRMDFDDDSSAISSSDVHSTGRSMSRMSQMSTVSQLSQMSFATVASVDTVGSDPGPSRSMIRNRPSLLGLNRMTSTASSLRTSFDFASSSNLSVPSPIPPVPPLPQMRLLTPSQSYPRSTRTPHTPHTPHTARSSNSFSLDGQLAHDFRTQASMETDSPHMNGMNGSVSPPPINLNILSLSASPSLSPRPSLDSLSISSPSPSQSQWTLHPHQRAETLSSRRGQASPGQIHVMAQRRSMSHSPSPYESRELREYDYRERERSQEPGERGRGSMYPAQHGCDAQGVGGYYHANNHPPQGVVVGTNPGLKHSRSESDDINPIFKVVSFSYGSDSRGLDLALADKAKDKYTSVFNANLNPSSPSTSSYASSSYASSISYSHSHSLSLSSYSQPPLPTPSTSSESEEYYHDNDSESDAMDTYQGDYTYSAMDDRMESPDPQDYSSDDYHSSGVMYGDQHQYHRNPNPAAYPHPHPSPDPNATHLNGLPNGLHRHHQRHPPSLPPFAALDAVAGGGYDYSSLSPMSFTTPLESDSSSS